ncbi:hypothetical protein [Bacillus thuringiensis]|uniref:hypothetical protein n=1 Tax=Bacillus thuringiensis TaxID=1428 RepID=UPI0021D64CC4|nr:hypothetical protein [Bacillus thuringiensis]MCU7667637.1 hypothetical protein [Bacillus thuringiensis]
MTYVAVISYGYGDNERTENIYAGPDGALAEQKVKDFKFPDKNNNFGWVEIWNGEEHSIKEII